MKALPFLFFAGLTCALLALSWYSPSNAAGGYGILAFLSGCLTAMFGGILMDRCI